MPLDPKYPISKAMDHPAEDEAPEVEGHIGKRTLREGPADAPEVEGHGYRRFAVPDVQDPIEAEAEVEGHAMRTLGPAEQAVASADTNDSVLNDTESAIKRP